MIKVENVEVYGWEAAIRGMRNPMNSWEKSDSHPQDWCEIGEEICCGYHVGENDLALMRKLAASGPDHRKFLRMITVTCDITAMQPWWAEFDTYKVGTVRNSCSKMHTIHTKAFEMGDFSTEGIDTIPYAQEAAKLLIATCEQLRQDYNETKDRRYWRALIELLPEGYNMRATVQLNYEVLTNMYRARKNHKLAEWLEFCCFIQLLPYSELITG